MGPAFWRTFLSILGESRPRREASNLLTLDPGLLALQQVQSKIFIVTITKYSPIHHPDHGQLRY